LSRVISPHASYFMLTPGSDGKETWAIDRVEPRRSNWPGEGDEAPPGQPRRTEPSGDSSNGHVRTELPARRPSPHLAGREDRHAALPTTGAERLLERFSEARETKN